MPRYRLPALLTAALWTAAALPVFAQTAPNPDTLKPTAPVAAAANGDVVGSVNGKQFTFVQVLDRLKRDNPAAYTSVVGQALGAKVADQLFGAAPQPSVTLTQQDAIATLRANPPAALYQVLESMLRDEAITQEAAKYNAQVSDADVDAYLARLLKTARAQGRIPPTVSDEQALAQTNLTREQLRQQLRPALLVSVPIQKDFEKKIGHPLGPDDFYQVRHILILTSAPLPVPGQPADPNANDPKKREAAALAKITRINTEIKSGKKTFEAAAKEYSEDQSNKDKGGDLGPSMRGQMVKEFEDAALALKTPGQIVGPVKTQYGYHLIQLIKTGKELTPEQRKQALDNYTQDQQRVAAFVQNLMADRTKIVNNLPRPNMGLPGGLPGGAPGGPRPMPAGGPRPAPGGPRPVPPPAPSGTAPGKKG